MIGLLAESERSLIVERTRAGINEARRRGVKFGRKKKLTPAQIAKARKLIEAGERVEDVAVALECGPHDALPCPGRIEDGNTVDRSIDFEGC